MSNMLVLICGGFKSDHVHTKNIQVCQDRNLTSHFHNIAEIIFIPDVQIIVPSNNSSSLL